MNMLMLTNYKKPPWRLCVLAVQKEIYARLLGYSVSSVVK